MYLYTISDKKIYIIQGRARTLCRESDDVDNNGNAENQKSH